MAAVSATIVGAVFGSGAARQTAATQVWISIGGHSERALRDSRTVRQFTVAVMNCARALAMSSRSAGIFNGIGPRQVPTVLSNHSLMIEELKSTDFNSGRCHFLEVNSRYKLE